MRGSPSVKLPMIDTHTHPYLDDFEDGGLDAVGSALASGVSHMVLPNVNAASVGPMKKLHEAFAGVTHMALGLHPTEVDGDWVSVVDGFEAELGRGGYVAVGEIGMDLHWDTTRRREQKEAFRRQLEMAGRLGLPAIIHCREGLDDVLEVIGAVHPRVPLVFHSFTGSSADVGRIRETCDPMFGINGVCTFKNAKELHEAIPAIGLERIVLETDAPYLAPAPHRGTRNEPSYVGLVCKRVAELLGVSAQEVEEATDRNAKQIFGL